MATVAIVTIVAVALGLDRLSAARTAAASPSPAITPFLPTPVPGTSETGASPPSGGSQPTIDPAVVAGCAIDDLAMAAGGWSGATGSMAGGAALINVSIEPCRVEGTPGLELLANDGGVIATGRPALSGPAVVMQPGGVAGVITVWSNWCDGARPGALVLRLSLSGEVGFVAPVVDWGSGSSGVPRCDTPNAPSTIDAPEPFAPPEPPEGGDGVEACAAGGLAAYLGPWGAAAGTMYANVVVLNRAGVGCLLEISPPLEMRDGAGIVVATAERWADPDSTLTVPAGWAALTRIGFADWCVAKPSLPLRLDLRIGDGQLQVLLTSERSEIGLPTCNSAPATPPPSLAYDGPFEIPGIGAVQD